MKRSDWSRGRTYFAYALSAERGIDGLELTFDAVPQAEVASYVRLLRVSGITDQAAQQIQRNYLTAAPHKNLIIRGILPARGEDLGGNVRGRFAVDRWYSLVLSEVTKGDVLLTLWPMNNPLDEEPMTASLERGRVLRGPLRRALDSLFTLRGSRGEEDEPAPPPPKDAPREGGQLARRKPTASPVDLVDYDNVDWIGNHLCSMFMLDSYVPTSLSRAMTRYVGVINVGQGSCAAIYDADLQPIAYLDFGLPTTSYMHSAPWNLNYLRKHHLPSIPHGLNGERLRHPRPCLCRAPLVVLSHGHHDHWYGLNLVKQQFKDKSYPVLGPASFTAPALSGLWSQLTTDTVSKGSCRSFSWGWVVACTGNKANSGGLATYVRVKDAPGRHYPASGQWGVAHTDPVFFAEEEYVLLPGDADYDKIPGIEDPDLVLVGLVASHHGALLSKKAFGALPRPAVSRAPIVYSYGLRDAGLSECMPVGRSPSLRKRRQLNNRWADAAPTDTQERSYEACGGHPRAEAVEVYDERGWIERCNTAREENGRRNAQQGNWLVGHSGVSAMRGTTIRVCSDFVCPMNEGCRASHFQIS